MAQARIVEKYLLNDERGDSLAQLGAPLHNAKAQWNNLRLQQEADDLGVVDLDERANDAERGQA